MTNNCGLRISLDQTHSLTTHKHLPSCRTHQFRILDCAPASLVRKIHCVCECVCVCCARNETHRECGQESREGRTANEETETHKNFQKAKQKLHTNEWKSNETSFDRRTSDSFSVFFFQFFYLLSRLHERSLCCRFAQFAFLFFIFFHFFFGRNANTLCATRRK